MLNNPLNCLGSVDHINNHGNHRFFCQFGLAIIVSALCRGYHMFDEVVHQYINDTIDEVGFLVQIDFKWEFETYKYRLLQDMSHNICGICVDRFSLCTFSGIIHGNHNILVMSIFGDRCDGSYEIYSPVYERWQGHDEVSGRFAYLDEGKIHKHFNTIFAKCILVVKLYKLLIWRWGDHRHFMSVFLYDEQGPNNIGILWSITCLNNSPLTSVNDKVCFMKLCFWNRVCWGRIMLVCKYVLMFSVLVVDCLHCTIYGSKNEKRSIWLDVVVSTWKKWSATTCSVLEWIRFWKYIWQWACSTLQFNPQILID